MQPTGSQYTGVDESHAGRKPGIQKTVVTLDYGIYKALDVKLTVQYHGHADDEECEHPLKVKVTLPEKWLDNPTPASMLKAHFMKAYRKKHPVAELSQQDDEDINLAIKDESLFMFSRELLADQSILTEVLYDRQDVWVMGPADWDAMEARLSTLRRAVVDALQHTLKSVRHGPEQIVPVTDKRQLLPGNSYVILCGWYKQQCVIVTPEFTVADLKAYLHHKNGVRMPMESLDIGFRTGDEIVVLDDGWTLNQVYEHMTAQPTAKAKEGEEGAEKKGSEQEEEGEEESVLVVPDWDEPAHAGGSTAASSSGAGECAAEGGGTVAGGAEAGLAAEMARVAVSAAPSAEAVVDVPSFFGKTMVLLVGKRMQDRKHQIWLPSVHDPYSFRTPQDELPQGGASALPALHAPKGWHGGAEPSVGQDENCCVM